MFQVYITLVDPARVAQHSHAPEQAMSAAVRIGILGYTLLALATAVPLPALSDTEVPKFPPKALAGPWLGSGEYHYDDVGLNLHISREQQVLSLNDKLPEAVRGCYDHVEALVHDNRGLSFVGRTNSDHPVVGAIDELAMREFRENLESYRTQRSTIIDPSSDELQHLDRVIRNLGQRNPARQVEWAQTPTYDAQRGIMRWGYAVQSGWVRWSASFWVTFDRDGFVTVLLISRQPDPYGWDYDAAPPRIAWTLPISHLPALMSPKGRTDTAGRLAADVDRIIMDCAFALPFGDNF